MPPGLVRRPAAAHRDFLFGGGPDSPEAADVCLHAAGARRGGRAVASFLSAEQEEKSQLGTSIGKGVGNVVNSPGDGPPPIDDDKETLSLGPSPAGRAATHTSALQLSLAPAGTRAPGAAALATGGACTKLAGVGFLGCLVLQFTQVAREDQREVPRDGCRGRAPAALSARERRGS